MGRKTKALEENKVRVVSVVRGWGKSAWESFVGPRGYLALVTLFGAYVGYYSIVEARHERNMNRASFERATFMSMVSSGNPASLTAAMKRLVRFKIQSFRLNLPWRSGLGLVSSNQIQDHSKRGQEASLPHVSLKFVESR